MKSYAILLFTAFFVSILVIDVQARNPIAPPAYGNPENIPSREEVGVPVPENTYFLSTMEIKRDEMYDHLYYNFVSESTAEQATSFYLEKLNEMDGWKYSKKFFIFYKDEEPFSFEKWVPTISIVPISEGILSQILPKQSKLRDKIKSRIILDYRLN